MFVKYAFAISHRKTLSTPDSASISANPQGFAVFRLIEQAQ